MEKVNCIFCNSNNSPVIEENGYTGRKCNVCNLIYISPRPSAEEMIKLYHDDNGLMSSKMHLENEPVKRLLARHNLKLLRKYNDGGDLLEIGAGGGYFLDEAHSTGYCVFGIEPNKVMASHIRDKLSIPCEDMALNDAFFEGKKFDIIYHRNVLSHLDDPIAEFKKIYGRLKDSGVLVFETGNIGEINEKYYELFYEFGYPHHLFFLETRV